MRFAAWDGARTARIDFFLLDHPQNYTTVGSVPVQYKAWAGAKEVIDDLLLLGLWWPGAGAAPNRRLMWSLSVEAGHAAAVLQQFNHDRDGAIAHPNSPHPGGWRPRDRARVAAWHPQVRLNQQLPVLTNLQGRVATLYEFEVFGWAGPTPAAALPGYIDIPPTFVF